MSGRGDATKPADDGYDRVTNPERYLSLHRAAGELIDRLVTTYDVARHDGVDLDAQWVEPFPGSRSISLVPAGGGATIVFTFTSFPGVMVKYGYGGRRGFPSCGCDACNEEPDGEAERLADLVKDVVAGGFTEIRKRRFLRADSYESTLVDRHGSGWWSKGGGTIEPELDDVLPTGTSNWSPWKNPVPKRGSPSSLWP